MKEKLIKNLWVASVVDPTRHPLLLFKGIEFDFPILTFESFLPYPHCMVTGDAFVSFGASEEAALGGGRDLNCCYKTERHSRTAQRWKALTREACFCISDSWEAEAMTGEASAGHGSVAKAEHLQRKCTHFLAKFRDTYCTKTSLLSRCLCSS